MADLITGRDLVGWGLPSGPWFGEAVRRANHLRSLGHSDDSIVPQILAMVPSRLGLHPQHQPFKIMLDAETPIEQANRSAVEEHMRVLMRTPTAVSGAVMPDGCPSGTTPGTIPVGGVVAARGAIHPGWHSSDVCCSVALSAFSGVDDPRALLDAVGRATHFGPGGRRVPLSLPATLGRCFEGNPFLEGLEDIAARDLASQGDGNHFAYVGRRKSTGELVLVTHHGSRGFGNQIFKRGNALAKKLTQRTAPDVPSHNSWIPADTRDGEQYWEALQVAREWTRLNHQLIHLLTAEELCAAGHTAETGGFFWNEHNFVFRKADGLFYHGKGATPSWDGYSSDDSGLTLVPLNMAEPILVVSHRNNPDSLGFAPHGAGRNMSRTQHLRESGDIQTDRVGGYLTTTGGVSAALEAELRTLAERGLDIRSYCGVPDLSELPSAYKCAASVRGQIEKYDLARIEDEIEPLGSIMAGDWEKDAPWKKARAAKRAAAEAAQ